LGAEDIENFAPKESFVDMRDYKDLLNLSKALCQEN